MKKQIKIAALTAGALLGAAALVGATDINLYGSSAQYPYWAVQGADIAYGTGANHLGCTATTGTKGTNTTGVTNGAGGTCYAGQFTGCTSSLVPDHVLNFRYCSNNSVTGIQAVAGNVSPNPDGCSSLNQRKFVNYDGSIACQTVTGGVSDVQGEAFTQNSTGYKLGPMGNGTSATYTPTNVTNVNTAGLVASNTVITPFAFYVNNAVTATQCTAGLVGNLCTADSQCNSQAGATDGKCSTTATTINNISRIEAVQLFSGQVADWSFLGGYYTAQPVTLCFRHAGSGTHATLQYAVMNSAWGNSLPQAQVTGDDATVPTIWFNNGTGDEENCINGDNNFPAVNTPNGSAIGAIGYASADSINFGATLGTTGKSQNITQIKYNGYYATRSHLRNGEYDFYAVSYLYTNGTPSSLMADVIAYAQDPNNVPSVLANYWPALSEMYYVKSSDFKYPVSVSASNPQTP